MQRVNTTYFTVQSTCLNDKAPVDDLAGNAVNADETTTRVTVRGDVLDGLGEGFGGGVGEKLQNKEGAALI